MPSDTEILQAVERLRDEWPELLGDDAEKLAYWLSTTPGDDPEAVRQTANRVLDLLRAYAQAQTRLGEELGIKGDLTRLLYEPPAGGPGEVPAGTLMVCPVDPAHYRRRLRQKGQRLFCSEHGVALVPADSSSSKKE
jgi:hypothetical protein